ncbi:MAG: hypothetical protein JF610_00910 [Acidobacteria bacterium]|nr:hypothetical protein [Acidobacteriota bacterium]
MITNRIVITCAFAMTIIGEPVHAQDLSRYRTFELGAGVAAIAASTGVAASDARTIYERPALVRSLEWRPSRWTPGSTAESTDPVDRITFSFYNDQLFQIVVDYDRERTEGMTDADMTEAIAAIYGPGLKAPRAAARGKSQVEIESGTAVAQWADAKRAVVLYRTSSYREAYRLLVTDAAVANRARTGASESLRLDELDAPRREVERQKKERDDARAAAEKARHANKEQFIP